MWPIRPAGWALTTAQRATLEQLRQENQALRAEVAALEQAVRDLLDQNRQLQEKLDERARAATLGPPGGPVPAARVEEGPRRLQDAARSAARPPRGTPERP